MLKFIGALAGLAMLASCTWMGSGGTAPQPPASDYKPISVIGAKATAAERKSCEAAGGEIRRDGLAGHEICVQTYADAGKACRDSADCLGRCMITGEFADFDTSTDAGQCEVNDSPFGCYQTVEDGKATPALCVD